LISILVTGASQNPAVDADETRNAAKHGEMLDETLKAVLKWGRSARFQAKKKPTPERGWAVP
jgi:hypothetical protein